MADTLHSAEAAGADTAAPAPSGSGGDAASRRGEPAYQVTLWPHRSLSPEGFRWVMGIVAAGLAFPVIPFLGTPVGWGLLPFLIAAEAALWLAFRRSYRDGRLREVLRLWPDLVTVDRIEPGGRRQAWSANPYWVTLALHDDAKIESYVTLKGNGREIELGAFLSPDERVALHAELSRAFRRIGG